MSSAQTIANNVIYISNFPKKLPREVLETALREYGLLLSLNIIYKNDFSFAFAEFDDIRDAAFAVKEMNQKPFHGMNLKVQFKNKKPKEKDPQPQENSKKDSTKNSQSPNSTLETSSNIVASKASQQKMVDKSHCLPVRQHNNRKNSRESIQSDFSVSKSRSRSRRKSSRRRRNYQNWEPYHNQEQYRNLENSLDKYQSRLLDYKHRFGDRDLLKMYDMIKKMGKSLRRLQQRLDDYVYHHNNQFRDQVRRRN